MMVSNMLRFIDVWTDEYKVFFYGLNPEAKERRTDVSARLALRKQLKCKSFRWMLEHVYPEAVVYMKRYHLGLVSEAVEEFSLFQSTNLLVCFQVENVGFAGHCLDEAVQLKHTKCRYNGGTQFFILTENLEIRRNYICVDGNGVNNKVLFYKCHGQGTQKWTYSHKV